jgi:hypothetical protein
LKLVEEPGEIATRELPLERLTNGLPVILGVKKALGDGVKVGKIIGSQNLPLDDGKIDFNLVEATGVDRTIHQNETGVLVLKALDGGHAAMG